MNHRHHQVEQRHGALLDDGVTVAYASQYFQPDVPGAHCVAHQLQNEQRHQHADHDLLDAIAEAEHLDGQHQRKVAEQQRAHVGDNAQQPVGQFARHAPEHGRDRAQQHRANQHCKRHAEYGDGKRQHDRILGQEHPRRVQRLGQPGRNRDCVHHECAFRDWACGPR